MGARSTGNHPTTTKADGHLLEYFRQTFGAGGGGTNYVDPGSGHTATGGVINDYSEGGSYYRAHIFTGSGTFEVTELSPTYAATVDYLVVAGGGSGGPMHAGNLYSASGGGGAGG